jgi:CHAT domain-containing protein
MDESIEEVNSKFNIQNPKFEPDDDNIIPIFDTEYFIDDIVARFKELLKIIFGGDNFENNMNFIADGLDKKATESSEEAVRRYFLKEFYTDHIKRYKKRPIYWMFSSNPKGNGAFNVLIYMHRYQPDVVAKIRTDYLHNYQVKLDSEKSKLIQEINDNLLSGQTLKNAQRRVDQIEKYLIEIANYDVKLKAYADKMIKIDLDDGVKVNYCKFKDILVQFDPKLCK